MARYVGQSRIWEMEKALDQARLDEATLQQELEQLRGAMQRESRRSDQLRRNIQLLQRQIEQAEASSTITDQR